MLFTPTLTLSLKGEGILGFMDVHKSVPWFGEVQQLTLPATFHFTNWCQGQRTASHAPHWAQVAAGAPLEETWRGPLYGNLVPLSPLLALIK
jgi:hypothetical protein